MGTYTVKEVTNMIKEMLKRLEFCLSDETLKSKLKLEFDGSNKNFSSRQSSLKTIR